MVSEEFAPTDLDLDPDRHTRTHTHTHTHIHTHTHRETPLAYYGNKIDYIPRNNYQLFLKTEPAKAKLASDNSDNNKKIGRRL